MDPNNDPPLVLVYRAIPSDPSVRSSNSLFITESAGQKGKPERRLLFSGPSPAPQTVASRMGVERGTALLERRRLMLVDGVPVRLAISYFPTDAPEAGELAGDTFLPGGLQELFDRHGRRFQRAEETLVARLPTPVEAEVLQISPAEPVVEILRTSYDDRQSPVHTLQTICAASRHVFPVTQAPGDTVF
ncbi:MAG TPA: UTRA domain-containing protein [Actinomycetota bacterium]|nr:UTRA domain-containing protein [Actinomycetota bacterium]